MHRSTLELEGHREHWGPLEVHKCWVKAEQTLETLEVMEITLGGTEKSFGDTRSLAASV